MTAGSLTQLAAKGVQDNNLTVNPEKTFFKGVWKKHTNFATQAIPQAFSAGLMQMGSTVTATIPRKGDLVTDIWLEIDMSRIGNANGQSYSSIKRSETDGTHTTMDGFMVSYVPEVARAMLEQVELKIGGHTFDVHSAEWLHVYDELSVEKDKQPFDSVGKVSSRRVLGGHRAGSEASQASGTQNNDPKTQDLIEMADMDQKFYVPLRFWFNRETTQALPLVALMYHEVEIKVKLRSLQSIMTLNMKPFQSGLPSDQGKRAHIADTYEKIKGHRTFGMDPALTVSHGPNFMESKWAFPTKTDRAPATLFDKGEVNGFKGKAFYSFPEHGDALVDMKLLINYTFLDQQERAMFAQSDHHYLIDTVTEVLPTWESKQRHQVYDIGDINHPCKDLIWCVRPEDNVSDAEPQVNPGADHGEGGAGQGMFKWDSMPHILNAATSTNVFSPDARFWKSGGHVKDYFNFAGSSYINGEFEAFARAKLVLNGAERFDHDARFLREVNARDRYQSVPSSMIYTYPFAMDPCGCSPSGSLNFSRIDQARLHLDLGEYAERNKQRGGIPQSDVFVFARVHNIVKITQGMAGLMYAN